jgi:phosphodiesterase/alkaline phosphatase D-like protein
MRSAASRAMAGAIVTVGLAMGVASAAAATAPSATTGAASAIAASSATVAASVNPNGVATTYAFQYGPTTNYGTQSATAQAGSGTSAVSVHATLSGLVSGTTYHYRVVATSAAGTTAGADATFTTSKLPPGVSTSSPEVVTSSSATLAGSVDPNGNATNWTFEYGPTTAYGLQTPSASAGAGSSSTGVHADISGLSAGTTYHYRLVATSADGTVASADATFVTTGDRAAPGGTLPVVSETAAVGIGAHSVQLNGAVNPEGPATTWYFQYGLTSYYGSQTSPSAISGLGARPVNVQLSGLQSSSTYHFRLVAHSANGLYVGPDHTFTTHAAGRLRPAIGVSARERRNGGRVRLMISGALRLPGGVTAGAACNGTVEIVVQHAGSTLGLHRVALGRSCRYGMALWVRSPRHRRLTVVGSFFGNALLLPANDHRFVRV